MRKFLEFVVTGILVFLAVFVLSLALTGCGEFKCDCGDGRSFTAKQTSGWEATSCMAFCAGIRAKPEAKPKAKPLVTTAGYLGCRRVRGQLVCVARG